MFYKAVLNGKFEGQSILNMLYYRTGVGVDVGGLTLGGAEALANNIKQEIWDAIMKNQMPDTYMLESIDVYPINQLFKLVYSMPYHLYVAENGVHNGVVAGPATAVNIRFNLENTSIGESILGPRRGYVAIGPVFEADFGEDGKMVDGTFTDPDGWYNKLAVKLSENLEELTPPVIWFPIRVRVQRNPLGDGVLWTGYADIMGATIDPRMTWRRSRRVE